MKNSKAGPIINYFTLILIHILCNAKFLFITLALCAMVPATLLVNAAAKEDLPVATVQPGMRSVIFKSESYWTEMLLEFSKNVNTDFSKIKTFLYLSKRILTGLECAACS